VASSTGRAPSLPRSPLRRYSSKIRTGCANKRPSGSVRGAISNDRPYRDLTENCPTPVRVNERKCDLSTLDPL
jgi:hypothetical protein